MRAYLRLVHVWVAALALTGSAVGMPTEDEPAMRLTGESARRKFLIKVYSIRHYAEPPLRGDVFAHPGQRRIEMVFALAVGPERLKQEISKALRDRATPDEWARMQPSLRAFELPITSGVKRVDRFKLDWHAGDTLVSHFNAQQLTRIHDREFAVAMWSLWMGAWSLVDRNHLLRDWRER